MRELEFLESPVSAAKSELCYHCKDKISNASYIDDKAFCCNGCQAVYELLSNSGLNNYYQLAENPGIRIGQNFSTATFDHLDIESIRKNILAFASENIEKVRFHLPAIHCIACVWLFENLPRILPGVVQSRVNFLKREVYITYQPKDLKLSVLAATLTRIGYEPEINLQSLNRKKKVRKNTLIYQIKLNLWGEG